jgi:serine/threonine protein kinase
MIREQKYTAEVDVWSAGVLLYRMTVGQLPFVEDDVARLFQKIVFADPVLPQKLSPHLADLLHKMLTKDPEKRITLAKIKEHPWFSRAEYTALQTEGRRSRPRHRPEDAGPRDSFPIFDVRDLYGSLDRSHGGLSAATPRELH